MSELFQLVICKPASGDEKSSKMAALANPAIWHGRFLLILLQL